MKNNTINITPAPSALGAFVPTGSYQKNCKNITVTLLCNCVQEDGSENPTVISFAATDASQIYDIVNENGSLGLSKGIVNPKPFAGLGPFVPAGSYQNTSSKITVVIEAQCMGPNNTYLPSMLQFNQQELYSIIDIANTNGVLTLVSNYDTISTQVNACFTANTAALNTACKNAIVAAGLDPLNNYEWRNYIDPSPYTPSSFKLNSFAGLSTVGISGVVIGITSNTNNVFNGTITVTAKFGNPTGVVIPHVLFDPNEGGIKFGIDGYSIQVSGSISIEVNNNEFSIVNVSFNNAEGTCLSPNVSYDFMPNAYFKGIFLDYSFNIIQLNTIPHQVANAFGSAFNKLN